MKRGLLSLLLLFCSLSIAIAQQKVVKGVVTSSDDKLPVIGAAVVVVGQEKIGASTNLDGEFSFSVPSNTKQLRVTSMGYKPQVVVVKSGTLQIVLQPDNQALDELVVTAYGTVKKQSLVGSQASIDSKKLESRPITNVSSALIGAAPGVQVSTSAGQPGSSSAIRIRGFGSLNASSAPLIVIDGAVYTGSLADINTNDIKSVSVLKDAASTALYGSSAGNGVLLITTKSGSGSGSGDSRPQLTFSVSQGFTQRGMSFYDTVGVDDWMRIDWRQYYNNYFYGPNSRYEGNSEQATLAANVAVYKHITGAYYPYKLAGEQRIVVDPADETRYILSSNASGASYPYMVDASGNLTQKFDLKWADDLDWKDALLRTGNRREYNLSSSWSNQYVRSFLSVGYLTEDGYRVNTNYERFTARANVGYDVNKYFTLNANVNYMRSESFAPRTASGFWAGNNFLFLTWMPPFIPIHAHDANGDYVYDYKGDKVFDISTRRRFQPGANPVYAAQNDLSTQVRDVVGTRLSATVNILEDLSFTNNVSFDLISMDMKLRMNDHEGDQMGVGLLEIERRRTQSLTANQLLNYKKSVEKHNFDFLLGHESYKWSTIYRDVAKKEVVVPGIDEFPNYTSPPAGLTSSTNNYRKEGFFARVNYDYDGLYTASLSYRRDGSSRFARNKRWGNFWSLGAGWNVIRENFMESVSWVDNLRLRLSVGQTGNDGLLDSYGGADYYPHYAYLYGLGANNENAPGVVFEALGNPDLIWESQTSYDAAIDFGFFNRVRGSLEFFVKESSGLIFGFPLVASTGAESVNKNIGKLRNYGLEADINVDVIRNKDFRWSLGLNATIFRNKVVRLPEENRKDGIVELSKQRKLQEGKSIYDFYLIDWVGVDPDNGRSLYRVDDSIEGATTFGHANFRGLDQDRPDLTYSAVGAKRDFVGSAIPSVYGGFSTEFSWKSLSVSANFAYQLGGKVYDYSYRTLMMGRTGDARGRHVDNLKGWTRPGDKTNVPALGTDAIYQYNFAADTDQFLISRSALMLKSLALTYELPKEWYQSWGIKGLRVGLSGDNLFLLSARKGLNPMENFSGTSTAPNYQFARSITANLTLTL